MRVGAFAVWQDMRRTALFYSAAWGRVIFHKRLVGCVQSLVGPDVQWHHTLPPGAAVLWRTATWHCVGPNVSDKTRKILHVGYHYRWLRPTDYIQQDPELIARSSPIRRQLLGALATGSNPLGNDPDFHPSSQYWLTQNWEDVPLRRWAKEQTPWES